VIDFGFSNRMDAQLTEEVPGTLRRVSPTGPRRIGLFGGTFDPPHIGHLVTAVNVRHELDLDLVIMMVAHVPWQKSGVRAISPSEHRVAMVEAAVRGVERVEAGRLEIDRGGDSYTADTIAELREQHPCAEIHTILGDDAAAGLTSWTRWEEIVDTSTLVVVDRPGAPVELPPVADWVRVEVPRLEVSSTDLRARVTDGRPLGFLVPDEVVTLIDALGLYRDAA
jgi:nicotinate-nucleotide adenylyltransferase